MGLSPFSPTEIIFDSLAQKNTVIKSLGVRLEETSGENPVHALYMFTKASRHGHNAAFPGDPLCFAMICFIRKPSLLQFMVIIISPMLSE